MSIDNQLLWFGLFWLMQLTLALAAFLSRPSRQLRRMFRLPAWPFWLSTVGLLFAIFTLPLWSLFTWSIPPATPGSELAGIFATGAVLVSLVFPIIAMFSIPHVIERRLADDPKEEP